MFRYVTLAWDKTSPQAFATAAQLTQRLAAAEPDMVSVVDRSGLQIFCAGVVPGSCEPYLLDEGVGAVLGTVFPWPAAVVHDAAESVAAEAVSAFGPDDTRKILRSCGEHLLRAFWGRYIAFVQTTATSCFALRDPLGNLPCYYTQYRGVTVFFSHMSDCLVLHLPRFTVNWDYISSYVTGGQHFAEGTALREITEVFGGERISISRGEISTELLWNPFRLASDSLIDNIVDARNLLRGLVKSCTASWASRHASILHELSGGLDSSAVLAYVSQSRPRPRVTCITYFLPNGNSDERPYARLAARQTGCEHIEHPDEQLNLRELLHLQPLVNPVANLSFLQTSQFEKGVAAQKRATAIFNGVGGDYIYGGSSLQPATSDFRWDHGLSLRILRVALDEAIRTNRSFWRTLFAGVQGGSSSANWDLLSMILRHRRLARADLLQDLAKRNRLAHPWFHTDVPGRAGVRFLAMALSYYPFPFYDPLTPADEPFPQNVAPLLSQPVVELCLRIPSYVHIAGGRDRGLARDAFVQDISPELAYRYWKDRGAGGPEAALIENLGFARELMLDGVLVGEGLLERHKVVNTLSGVPTKDATYTLDVFSYLGIEAWLREWAPVRREAVA